MKHSPGRFHFAYTQFRNVFGDEFEEISREDGVVLAQDYLDACDDPTETNFSAEEYKRRIGQGNLQSYVNTLRA